MLLSRFWYLILALALGAAVASTFVVQHYYNRTSERWMKDTLQADSISVGSVLKDDARTRASQLIPIALDKDVREGLLKADESDDLPREATSKVASGLTKLAPQCDPKFTTVYATDADGRVIGSTGGDYQVGANIGGYSVVADALAGWIRDDTWWSQKHLLRVVARPVERDGGGEPIGAIVGVTVIDNDFAKAIATRTGATIAVYANKQTVAAGLPYDEEPSAQDVTRNDLDTIQSDIGEATTEADYVAKGRSKVRRPREDLGIVYARMTGEAAELGAGYAVGRKITTFKTPWAFVAGVEGQDRDAAPRLWIILAIVAAGGLGILFSVLEHTMPLGAFKKEAAQMAQGKVDQLAPSRFRGAYKKIAADINDGVDKIAAKGGVPRRAADLDSVLGPIPAQPTMSAFSVPDSSSSGISKLDRRPPTPPPRPSQDQTPTTDAIPAPRQSGSGQSASGAGKPPPPPRPKPSGNYAAVPVAAASTPGDDAPFDEMADWKKVYEEYLNVRRKCGEPVDSLTFDKFKSTLERNKAALVERHNCTRVKFTVYEKDGKAALKASPLK